MIKSILKNIWNTYVLVACLLLAVPIVSVLTGSIGDVLKLRKEDERGSLVNYKGVTWAKTHFAEFNSLDKEFAAFTGWYRLPFSGTTISIDPVRRNRVTPGKDGLKGSVVYFFGGSTMWGTGSNDENTIPALYQDISNQRAVNMGETGWNAHQSLNQLIRIYVEGDRPDQVVFYDGVNDVAHKCRTESGVFGFATDDAVRSSTKYKPLEAGYYFRIFLALAEKLRPLLNSEESKSKSYDCSTDSAKAEKVAENLIVDWEVAKQLVESRGGKFEAFLQPIAFESLTRLDHLSFDRNLAAQFAAVYPIIKRKMRERGIGIDLTTSLNRDEYFYIDFCHLSPNGNAIMAQDIFQHLARN